MYVNIGSAFGHLDNISSTTRSVNHQIPVVDPHIRFERVSEVVPKSERHIEEVKSTSLMLCTPFYSLDYYFMIDRATIYNAMLSNTHRLHPSSPFIPL
jgi:hypothetical protein